ncbi:MAG: phosphoglucosamine mutase [Firmicutes bacterium]|nr:phosphoglucosamine mutase [Bacillota bacterium]HCX43512.1 phosphoglucosamine mutase [Oscillibacter sp.]
MGKLFGTDGIRGVVGETLTAELAYRVGQAITIVLTEQKGSAPTITIGKDTRISSDMLESALMAGICAMGGSVMPFGTIPTPAVAFLTVQEEADAGIVISASHNPYEHNGIKIFGAQGYKLSDEMEEKVEDIVLSKESLPVKTHDQIGMRLHGMRQMKSDYIDHLLSTVDCDMRGLRVLVDCANGAASATAPGLFGKLPLHADFIFDKPDGININNGCGSTHMETLCRGVVAGKYDLGIAFDGDADRCLLVDEKGHIIDGDKVLAVCGKAMRRKGSLNGNAIVATVMSNLGLHEFCRKGDFLLVCTDVGDRHVLEKMIECGYMIGGEQSGHTIFREYATTGDGELTALQFIQAYCEAGVPASELVSCCAQYPQELINVPVSAVGGAKERIMADDRLWEQVRSQEEALNGEGRILVRPSGTEALIRVMVEAKTVEIAHNVAKTLAEFIKTL